MLSDSSMNQFQNLAWILLMIVIAAVLKGIFGSVYWFFASGAELSTAQGIIALLVGISIGFVVWAIIAALSKTRSF